MFVPADGAVVFDGGEVRDLLGAVRFAVQAMHASGRKPPVVWGRAVLTLQDALNGISETVSEEVPRRSAGRVVPQDWVDTRTAADRLGVTSRRVAQLVASGRLVAVRRVENGPWRICPASIDEEVRRRAEAQEAA